MVSMSKKTLVSWVGHNDLWAMAGDLPPKQREKVYEEIGEPKGGSGQGPLRSLFNHVEFDAVHLLSNQGSQINRWYVKWLGYSAKVHPTDLENPTDYGAIFQTVKGVLQSIPGISKAELHFHLSPGTPAMAGIWILLAKSLFPATLHQTFRDKATIAEIPFDITVDVLPEFLRDPDLLWQHLLTRSPREIQGFEGITGESPAIRLAVGRAQRVAVRDVPALIVGASGTGKERFAQAIHAASHRSERPFVAVNCAAFSSQLLESELFGHRKGAFTGAESSYKGVFEQADGGTLFLDEVGECDPSMQAKLLRVLQPSSDRKKGPCHRVFRSVGATKDSESDVRIVAATNRDLHEAIADGEFREDLFYRLATVTLKLPPLEGRKEDIPLLAEALLADINSEFHGQEPSYVDKSLSPETKAFLKSYIWPGNVRELQNALVQAAVMAETEILGPEDISAALADFPRPEAIEVLECPLGNGFSLDEHLGGIQRHFLVRAMKEAAGNKTKAARLLGIKHYQTLDAQLERLGVDLNGS